MNAYVNARNTRLVMTLRQFLCNRPISVSYAYKKETKGERLDMARHGWSGWRLANLQCAMVSTCVNLKKSEECIYGFIHIPKLQREKNTDAGRFVSCWFCWGDTSSRLNVFIPHTVLIQPCSFWGILRYCKRLTPQRIAKLRCRLATRPENLVPHIEPASGTLK